MSTQKTFLLKPVKQGKIRAVKIVKIPKIGQLSIGFLLVKIFDTSETVRDLHPRICK